MSNQEQAYLELVRKQLQGTLSTEEQDALQAWADSDPNNALLVRYITESRVDRPADELEAIYEKGRQKYFHKTPVSDLDENPNPVYLEKRGLGRYQWIGLAAGLLIFFLAGYYLYQNHSESSPEFYPIADVAPGQHRATLTLENGSVIVLDDSVEKQSVLSAQGISISENEGGELIYDVAKIAADTAAVAPRYHTINTPAGGRYQVNLPDGSRVWLNAESSLRYPVPFESSQRHVELSGEAYFEVAKLTEDNGDKRVPFVVLTEKQKVEVLGTHFNINAYKDEPVIKTTLLEGSVRVECIEQDCIAGSSKVLRPGEQAVYQDQQLHVQTVDTAPAVAWKEGMFVFNDEELHAVMRRIERWYDVEVRFQDELPPLYLGGSVSSNKNLSEVLKIIELTGEIQCRIEASGDGQERRVVIMK